MFMNETRISELALPVLNRIKDRRYPYSTGSTSKPVIIALNSCSILMVSVTLVKLTSVWRGARGGVEIAAIG